METKILTQN